MTWACPLFSGTNGLHLPKRNACCVTPGHHSNGKKSQSIAFRQFCCWKVTWTINASPRNTRKILPSRRGCLARTLNVIAALTLLFVCVGLVFIGYWYFTPYQGFGTETFVEIEHGMSSQQIAQTLQRQGVIRSHWAFLFLRGLHPGAPLQAGEYRFGSPQTPWQVFQEIRKGQTFYEELTIPEGSNIFDIAAVLAKGDTVKSDDFLKEAANPKLIKDLDPLAPNLEGYLFPSTYRVTHHTTARQLCQTMTLEFRNQWAALQGAQQDADIHRVVV